MDRPMQTQPLVSIIIPVYNQENFVGEAIDSALGQNYSNRELLLIDDASTDGSSRVLERYKGHTEVKIVRNPKNLDCAGSFNRGIALSRGKYFAILAADDSWEPDFIGYSIAALEYHTEAAFSYSRINLMDEKGNKRPREKDRIVHQGDFYGDDFVNIVRWLNPIPHHATVVRRQCFNSVGTYNESLTTTHDWELWLRLSRRYPVVFIDKYLSNYRVHAQNVTKTRSRLGLKEKFIIQLLDWIFLMDGLSEELLTEKNKIYCKAWLDIADAYREVSDIKRMRSALFNALSNSLNVFIYAPYRRLLLSLLWPV